LLSLFFSILFIGLLCLLLPLALSRFHFRLNDGFGAALDGIH
jgi:hypothetical protein